MSPVDPQIASELFPHRARRFLVRPKAPATAGVLSTFGVSTGAAARGQQIEHVKRIRSEDPSNINFRRWLRDTPSEVLSWVGSPPALDRFVAGSSLADQDLGTGSDSSFAQRLSTSSVPIEGVTREGIAFAPLGPVSGYSLVEMSSAQAKTLRDEIPELEIIEDVPTRLIAPQRSTASVLGGHRDLWHIDAIGLAKARSGGFKGSGAGVVVGVLDTGVDGSHVELAGKVSSSWGADSSRTQFVSRASGDTHGHGTHVAGLVCGSSVGVAPGSSVIDLLVLPRGSGMLSDFILAMEWAAQRPEVSVINVSAGFPTYISGMSDAMNALRAVGVIPIAAVGNDGVDHTSSPGNYKNAVTVGAHTKQGTVATFSGSGNMVDRNQQYAVPDLVAPGEQVTSCVMGGRYEAWDGSSMAAPIVSGIVALMLEKYPSISVQEVEELLVQSCVGLGPLSVRQGSGAITVSKLL